MTPIITKASQTIGKKVLTKKDGENIAKVHDVVYNPYTNKIAYLIIDEGGWFSNAKIIAMSDVEVVGEDRVMVESYQTVQEITDKSEKLYGIIQNNDELKQLDVVTEDGTKLGQITDLYYNGETGDVTDIEISQGVINNIVSGKKRVHVSNIITVGTHAMIVKVDTEQDVEEQAKQQNLTGAMHATGETVKKAQDNIKETAVAAKDKTVEVAHVAQEKAVVVGHGIADKSKEVAAATQEKVGQVKSDWDNSDTKANLGQKATEFKDATVQKTQEVAAAAKVKAQETKEYVASGQMKEDVAHKAQDVKDATVQKTHEAADATKQKAGEFKQNASNSAGAAVAATQASTTKIGTDSDLIGHYLQKDLLHPATAEVIASRGDVINIDLIHKAKQKGVLEQLYACVY